MCAFWGFFRCGNSFGRKQIRFGNKFEVDHFSLSPSEALLKHGVESAVQNFFQRVFFWFSCPAQQDGSATYCIVLARCVFHLWPGKITHERNLEHHISNTSMTSLCILTILGTRTLFPVLVFKMNVLFLRTPWCTLTYVN